MLRSLKPALIPSSCLFFLSLCLFIAGCGVGPSTPPSIIGTQLQGHVHGGQQPVSGSTIQLYAAGTSGYGAGAIALIANPIVTDSSGSFSITAQYQCPSSSSQLYIVATGGNPGLGSSIEWDRRAMFLPLFGHYAVRRYSTCEHSSGRLQPCNSSRATSRDPLRPHSVNASISACAGLCTE